MMRSSSVIVFACKSKACAPPPVGTGGSTPTGAAPSGVRSVQDAVDESSRLVSRLAYSDAKAYGAIVNYRGTLYKEINATLRGTASGTTVSKEVLDDMQRGFDTVSVALPEHAVMFRGMSVPVDYSGNVRKQLMSMFPEGSEFVDKGYVSTSRQQSTASSFATKDVAGKHPVRFFITVPKGTKVMAGHPLEQEVVLNKGTRFRVVDSSVRNVRNSLGELQDMLDVSLEVLR